MTPSTAAAPLKGTTVAAGLAELEGAPETDEDEALVLEEETIATGVTEVALVLVVGYEETETAFTVEEERVVGFTLVERAATGQTVCLLR